MRYVLGIHIGATRVTAAVRRCQGGHWGQPEVVPLDAGAPWLDAVLHVSDDGELLAGRAALQRAPAEPEHMARAPLQRVGDTVPFVLGEIPYPAESLAAGLIGWVADRVCEAESGPPERIVVTHPPDWSHYRRGLLHDALEQAHIPGVLALPSPIAAAENYAAHAEIPIGQMLTVGRLGGEHAEAAVLRRSRWGFDLITQTGPGVYEAGSHLDDLLVQHVVERTGTDQEDPAAMAQLRTACTAAKERLCRVEEVLVTDDVLLTRKEFEALIQPVLAAALHRWKHLVSAVPTGESIPAVLIGGTARIPLAGQLTQIILDCPVMIDDDPGTALCRGAALAAQPWSEPVPEAEEITRSLITDSAELPTWYRQGDDQGPPPDRPPVEITPLAPPKRRFSRTRRAESSAIGSAVTTARRPRDGEERT